MRGVFAGGRRPEPRLRREVDGRVVPTPLFFAGASPMRANFSAQRFVLRLRRASRFAWAKAVSLRGTPVPRTPS